MRPGTIDWQAVVRRLRERYTVSEAARLLEVNRATLWKLEHGTQAEPKHSVGERMLVLAGCSGEPPRHG